MQNNKKWIFKVKLLERLQGRNIRKLHMYILKLRGRFIIYI